jgi:membrane protein DedA with SNARE-associated domain
MLDGLLELVSASDWTYAVILAVALLDAVLPIVPSEAAVVSAGALAGAGDLSIALVIAAATAGAFVGDNSAYAIGRVFGTRVETRLAGNERALRRRAWAEQKLITEAGTLLLAARFVPGGRTATTVTAGLIRLRWARFVLLTLAAGTAWATGVGLLGYAGGQAVGDNPYLGLALLVAAAAGVYAALRIAKRLRRRRSGARRPATAGRGLAMPQIRARLRLLRLGA